MNKSEINKNINALESWIKDLTTGGEGNPPEDFRGTVIWSDPELGSLTFWGDALQGYSQILDAFYKSVNEKSSEQLSHREIEQAIRDATLRSLDIKEKDSRTPFADRLKKSIDSLRERLTAEPNQWDIYVAVEGFAPHPSCLQFGEVRFLPADKSTLRHLRRESGAVIWASHNSIKSKKSFLKNNRVSVDEGCKGKVVAHVRVQAVDVEAAQNLALKELKLTLDVLNFFTMFVHPRGSRTRVYLPGESRYRAHTFAMRSTKSRLGRWVGLSLGIGGPMDLFNVSELDGEKGDNCGFAAASRILSLPRRNSLQERLVAALRFAGRACVNEIRDESFLGFAISLESLLGDKNSQGEINYKLGLRCAHLIGKDINIRNTIRNDLKKLYAVRSTIVHRGNSDLTDIQLAQIRSLSRVSLVTVLTNPDIYLLSSEDKFLDWFEEKIIA